jgi:hypothetical protein
MAYSVVFVHYDDRAGIVKGSWRPLEKLPSRVL